MTSPPSTAGGKSQKKFLVIMWLSISLMLVLPFGFFLSGLASAQRQHRIIQTCQPVQAKILTSHVTSYKESRGGVHFVPEVKYQYEVEGKACQSERLMPLYGSGTEEWAQSVVARFPAGESCTAFYDPQDPGQAILLKRYSFEPYFTMLEMAFCLAAGSFLIMGLNAEKKSEPVPADNGWFEFKPTNGERQRLLGAKFSTAAWYGLGAVAAAHFFLVVPPPHRSGSVTCFEIFALMGLVPLGLMIRYLVMNRNLEEARLLLDVPAGRLGRRFKFAISQRAGRQLQLKQVRIRLLCIGTKAKGRSRIRRTLYETTPVELTDHILHAGESLELPGELTPPADQRPAGRDASGEFDWINWQLRLECEVVHAPDYAVSFPLDVQAPPVDEPVPPPGEEPRAFVEVTPIDPDFAGRILTKTNLLIGNLVSMLSLLTLMAGIGLMASVYLVVFPDKTGSQPFWDLPRPQALLWFAGGGVLAAVSSIFGIVFPSLPGVRFLCSVAKRTINRRRDAIVRPGADSLFVGIIPRTNWNRMMLQNTTDIGFLTVDAQRREIRFEGDKERYRIPAEALRSCELEKSFFMEAARPNAAGIWLAVIRASGKSGPWEAPVNAGAGIGRNSTKLKKRAAQDLQARIQALLPSTKSGGERKA